MNDNSEQIAATLKRSLCESFAVRADGADRWVIRSPFLFSDGDVVPATLVLGAGGQFCLTDEGMAASHLFFDDFAYTDARFNRIEMLADAHGAVIGPDRDVVMVLDGVPSAFDIADFLALMSQIQGVALTTRTERDQARFVTTVRTQIERRLATPDFEENWSPPELRTKKASYRADLRISATDRSDVVVFAASTSEKAGVSALTVRRFKEVRSRMMPILAYHPDRVSSEAIYRFQDEVDDENAAIPTFPDSTMALVAALRDRGVELTTAA